MVTEGDRDDLDALLSGVARARRERRPVYIRGGDSKAGWLGRSCYAAPLEVGGHRGIVDYQPAELFITARAGTPVAVLAAALAAEQQMIGGELPQFGGRATVGGSLACNLSGPGRPWMGSLRDAVLGVKLINGLGQHLTFGGRVMKNVAGYDISRLQAGALGCLGAITEVTLKLLPVPEQSVTLCFAMDKEQAILTMNRRAGEPAPLTAAAWVDGQLYLRLAGAERAVAQTAANWGGERIDGDDFWQSLREMSHPFFQSAEALWRLSIGSSCQLENEPDEVLLDWGGAQRWYRSEPTEHSVIAAGGHTTLFLGGDRSGELRTPLPEPQQRLQQRLKQAFDPDGLFNPGVLYSWM